MMLRAGAASRSLRHGCCQFALPRCFWVTSLLISRSKTIKRHRRAACAAAATPLAVCAGSPAALRAICCQPECSHDLRIALAVDDKAKRVSSTQQRCLGDDGSRQLDPASHRATGPAGPAAHCDDPQRVCVKLPGAISSTRRLR